MKLGTFTACVFALGITGSGIQAQTMDKKTITLDGARKVVAAAMIEARRVNSGGVIAVVDEGGNLVTLDRIDGSFAAGANISIGKARTAAIFKKPTKFFEEIIKNGRTAMVALNDFTPLQGGEPILIDGQIVGAVGVSGASNADEDEKMALAGAAAFSSPSATYQKVDYFERDKVAAAFLKGAVLLDGSDGRNFMVHASRREMPGGSEVHTQDADVIYVLDGTATFITGGTLVGGKNIAADEIRGTGIQGGQTYHLTKGDVIVVPRNTPHWFQEVTNPFTYYVVKVR